MQAHARRNVLANPTLVAGMVSIALGVHAAQAIARSHSLSSVTVTALLGLASVVLLLSLRPETVFLSWLALAPLLQESASSANALGHQANLALYAAPPLVFALWTLTRPAKLARPRFVDVLPLAFFLLVMSSLFLTAEPSSTLVKAVYTTIGIGVFLYYFFAFGPIGSLTWEHIVGLLLALCILEGAMSIVDGLTGWNLWNDTSWIDGSGRTVATLSNPAVLSTFLGMGIVLAVSTLVWHGPSRSARWQSWQSWSVSPASSSPTRVADSRDGSRNGSSSWRPVRERACSPLPSLILAVGVVAASWSQITESSVYSERIANEENVEGRLLVQDQALRLAAQRPLFGWGYGSFDRAKTAAGFAAEDVQRFGAVSTSHNTYLTVLVEYGTVGLLLYS